MGIEIQISPLLVQDSDVRQKIKYWLADRGRYCAGLIGHHVGSIGKGWYLLSTETTIPMIVQFHDSDVKIAMEFKLVWG